jgi:lipopolysaccharide transport system ATP-binding protein
MKPILEVKNISKKFRIQHLSGGYLSLRERVLNIFKTEVINEDFWALQNISFSLNEGESVGIVGRNGAGKSTLLKILSRITPPTKGKIITRGRIASLLEVGTGFHPELTGRENIFFNGSLLGMKKREILQKFDEIVSFSGTEKFLDTPLKHYSSGMQLRLAFSVAAFLEPEILIIDEVLAVGDAEFQKKCLGKMEDVSRSGRTILFVSHNMAAVENLCQRAILLKDGGVETEGRVSEVIAHYQQSFDNHVTNAWTSTEPKGEVYFSRCSLSLIGEQPSYQLEIKFSLISIKPHKKGFVAFDISNSLGITVMQAIPVLEPFVPHSESEQCFTVRVELPPLIPDRYMVSFWMGSHNTETLTWEKDIISFEITESPTRNRNYPHSFSNGFIAPVSHLVK